MGRRKKRKNKKVMDLMYIKKYGHTVEFSPYNTIRIDGCPWMKYNILDFTKMDRFKLGNCYNAEEFNFLLNKLSASVYSHE